MTPLNTPWYLDVAFRWFQKQPVVPFLMFLMVADVIIGTCLAVVKGKLNSTASWRGMCKKTIVLILLGISAAAGNLLPSIPILQFVGAYYSITELISCLENAAAAGIPIPKGIVATLSKLRDQRMEQAMQKQASTVNNITVLSTTPPSPNEPGKSV